MATIPAHWADTPTQTWPARVSSGPEKPNTGAESDPLLTLSHSTTTVPLKRPSSLGRRIRTRVVNSARSRTSKVQRPSVGSPAGAR